MEEEVGKRTDGVASLYRKERREEERSGKELEVEDVLTL